VIPGINGGQDLPARRKYHTLDGIRGAAALMILIRHAGFFFGNFGVYISNSESYLAVDLFFVLSGFVIAGAYDKRLAGGLSPIEFIKIRVIRLYPLYFLGLLIGTVSGLFSIYGNNTAGLTGPKLVKEFALAFFMLPSPFSADLYPLNLPSWSLFFEMIVNGLYAAAYSLLNSARLISVIAIAAAGLGFCAYQNGDTDGGGNWAGFTVGVLRVLYSFGMGLLIHRFHTKMEAFRVPSWILITLVILTLSVTPSAQARPWYDMVAVILVFPAIVHIASASEPGSPKVTYAYSVLGTTSYAVYILHNQVASFISRAVRGIFKCNVAQFAPFSGIAFALVFVYGCWLLDLVYDLPVRRWATKVFLKK
jgi:peptidoglycan/LPS O-acetylase OafA/YrhL